MLVALHMLRPCCHVCCPERCTDPTNALLISYCLISMGFSFPMLPHAQVRSMAEMSWVFMTGTFSQLVAVAIVVYELVT